MCLGICICLTEQVAFLVGFAPYQKHLLHIILDKVSIAFFPILLQISKLQGLPASYAASEWHRARPRSVPEAAWSSEDHGA